MAQAGLSEQSAFFILTNSQEGASRLLKTIFKTIFNPISELTELLRHKEQGDYKALYNQSLEKINELKTLLD